MKDAKNEKSVKGAKGMKNAEDMKDTKSAEKMKAAKKKEAESQFQDRLPEEILKELTPEVRRQYFLWDEIMKREIELYPWLILPVIEEIFHKKYPAGGKIILLSAEYTVSRIHEKGEKLLHAVRSDLLLEIERDRYHFECQIGKDGNMVFRMLEYDMQIALTHGKIVEKENGKKTEFSVVFPRSAVLYLGSEKSQPDYTPEMIEEKHLNLLVPFLPASGSRSKRPFPQMIKIY